MAPYAQSAGSAAALLGTVHFAIGAGAGALVSTLHNGTADGGYHHPPWRRCAALFAAFGATSVGSNAGAAVIERNFLHNYSAIS